MKVVIVWTKCQMKKVFNILFVVKLQLIWFNSCIKYFSSKEYIMKCFHFLLKCWNSPLSKQYDFKGALSEKFPVSSKNYIVMLLNGLFSCQNILWNVGERYLLICCRKSHPQYISGHGFKMTCKNLKNLKCSKCSPFPSLPSWQKETVF